MSGPGKQALADLQKAHRITEAEALWVLRQDDLGENDAVKAVKQMRVGPYATAEFLETVGEDEVEPERPFPWPDGDIGAANAADLVDYVKEHPEEAERVAQIEGSREGGPRKTVLDAVASVTDDPEEES